MALVGKAKLFKVGALLIGRGYLAGRSQHESPIRLSLKQIFRLRAVYVHIEGLVFDRHRQRARRHVACLLRIPFVFVVF